MAVSGPFLKADEIYSTKRTMTGPYGWNLQRL